LQRDRDPSDSDGHGDIGYVPMAVTGYLEQAKAAAQRTFIPGTEPGGAGQDDIAAPVFLAFAKEARAGRCVDAALAMLAVVASQALHVTARQAPPPLGGFVEGLRAIVPPLDGPRVLGPELGHLAESFTKRVFAPTE
jgi:histidine ammonia-lyase